MKAITVYEAEDGRRFEDRKSCEIYEADGCVEFKPLPKYCDHRVIAPDQLRWMLNGDGDCYYATATRYAPRVSVKVNNHPTWATHLVYFGK